MPLYLYTVEPPGQQIPDGLDAAAEHIRREFPAWNVEPKVDRCRLGTPLCRRPIFSDLLLRLWRGDRVVLPSPIVLYGATEHDLKALFHGWSDRRVEVDIIWGDTVESTEDLTFVPRLLESWAKIEEGCRELLAKRDEGQTQQSPQRSKLDRREAVLVDWLVRMRDCGVPWDSLYYALAKAKIHQPNGREYSRGTIQNRVKARGKGAEIFDDNRDVEDSPEIVTLRSELSEIERTRLGRWMTVPANS